MTVIADVIDAVGVVDTSLQETADAANDLVRALMILKQLDAHGYEIVRRAERAKTDDG